LLKFSEAKELHIEQSTLAATAFLERNPKGFDNPDLLKQMFLNQAFIKANAYQAAEQPEFKSKQLHQKVEISGITILNTREDMVLSENPVYPREQWRRRGGFRHRDTDCELRGGNVHHAAVSANGHPAETADSSL
jgi:hypothetical protein